MYEKLTAKLGGHGCAPHPPAEEKKGSVVSRLIDTITGIFTPHPAASDRRRYAESGPGGPGGLQAGQQ